MLSDPGLLAHWRATVTRLGAGGDVSAAGTRLLAAHHEEHRAYHDARHLDEMLRHIDVLAAYCPRPAEAALAAWFHDAVYDPRRADNEERSAAYAEDVLPPLGLPASTVAEVARLVRLTATHDPAPDDGRGAVLCDADLAILAAQPQRYAAYTAGVRREYGHVGDAAFRTGRAQVLATLLDRPALYRTAYGAARWEAAARRNVAAELGLLRLSADGSGAGPTPAAGG